MIDLPAVNVVFGQMLRNAQALEALLRDADLHLDPVEAYAFTGTLQRISALTLQHGAMLHQLRREHSLDRREGQRRSGQDRRTGS